MVLWFEVQCKLTETSERKGGVRMRYASKVASEGGSRGRSSRDEGPTELMTVVSGGVVDWNHSGDDVEESGGCQQRRVMRCPWYGSTARVNTTANPITTIW